MSRLLADLTVMMATSPEDVATRALELIFQRSPAAMNAANKLIDTWRGRPGKPVARWVSQVGGTDNARTDLQGFDADDVTTVILENKFWAGLTDNQPNTYVERLGAQDGVLVFLVPTARVPLITHELSQRLRRTDAPVVVFENDGQTYVVRLPARCAIAVTSWSVLLNAIRTAMESAAEYENVADLRQLQGLVDKMERDGFRPLTLTELTGDTPRLNIRLCDLVDGAVQSLLTRSFADKNKLKATAGAGWYGHWFRLHGIGCQILVSSQQWSTRGLSPIWLRVMDAAFKFSADLRIPLRDAVDSQDLLFEDRGSWYGFWIPIRLEEGRERDVVIRGMVRQLDRVAVELGRYQEGRERRAIVEIVEEPSPDSDSSI